MKYLLTTRADATVADWAELVHPVFRKYAEKVGADFLILDESLNCTAARTGIGDGLWHFRIMKHYDLHEIYDRILHFDSDILLTPDCPNLFDHIPYDCIGTVYEDVGSRAPQRVQCMNNAQRQFGEIGWQNGYINTGVFMTSKCHRDIFQPIDGQFFTDWGTDDVHIGYQIKKHGFKVKPLEYQFNHMTMFSEAWNGSPDRFDSHVIHYAGRGVFDDEASDKIEQAKLDHKRLYG
tara:strand:- start:27447 stop:28151 length:705 start_codon:yes stop_codon:yes gene_type:complete